MLKSLYIKNYALFRETHVDFPHGLNILTGETGAGKSLLVGALGLIMGKRADTSAVFFPGTKCVVEATFLLDRPRLIDRLHELSEELELEPNDSELLLRREIAPSGKSRAFVNDSPVSLSLMREVATQLVDLHGQHENQSLLNPDRQLELLDVYLGLESEVAAFGVALTELQENERALRKLESKEAEAQQQHDFLQFQLQEFEGAQLEAGEEDQLEQELNLLQNTEDIREQLGRAISVLYQEEESLYGHLSEVVTGLEKVADVSNDLAAQVSQLQEAAETIRDSAFAFEQMLETVDADPARLAFIEERLALYHDLKRKYKVKDGDELIALYERLADQATDFASMGDRIGALRQNVGRQRSELAERGLKLEASRRRGLAQLEKQVNALLLEVGFRQAALEIELRRNSSDAGSLEIEGERVRPTATGLNRVTFMIRTNPGLPSGPLSQIASGGEISRVMLAIKAALADKSDFPVLIFDEIDTGISGETANMVGRVMRRLAERFQILSITHLPQIAGKGHQHYVIYKEIDADRTVSGVRRLDHEERVREVARMISGDDLTETALRNAHELIG